MDQVGQVRSNLAALAAYLVALVTRRLIAEEHLPAAQPVPARQFGNFPRCEIFFGAFLLDPRQYEAVQGQRSECRVLLRGERCFQAESTLRFLHHNLDGDWPLVGGCHVPLNTMAVVAAKGGGSLASPLDSERLRA